jgi:cystathionine gamma-synthase
LKSQSANAMAVAEALVDHPKAVSAVLYPGLPDHPGHAIAARQMTGGFGGLLSVRLKGGPEAARRWRRPPRSSSGHLHWRRGEPDRASQAH